MDNYSSSYYSSKHKKHDVCCPKAELITMIGPQGATGTQGPQGAIGSIGPQGPALETRLLSSDTKTKTGNTNGGGDLSFTLSSLGLLGTPQYGYITLQAAGGGGSGIIIDPIAGEFLYGGSGGYGGNVLVDYYVNFTITPPSSINVILGQPGAGQFHWVNDANPEADPSQITGTLINFPTVPIIVLGGISQFDTLFVDPSLAGTAGSAGSVIPPIFISGGGGFGSNPGNGGGNGGSTSLYSGGSGGSASASQFAGGGGGASYLGSGGNGANGDSGVGAPAYQSPGGPGIGAGGGGAGSTGLSQATRGAAGGPAYFQLTYYYIP